MDFVKMLSELRQERTQIEEAILLSNAWRVDKGSAVDDRPLG